jgi:hypothetical protein
MSEQQHQNACPWDVASAAFHEGGHVAVAAYFRAVPSEVRVYFHQENGVAFWRGAMTDSRLPVVMEINFKDSALIVLAGFLAQAKHKAIEETGVDVTFACPACDIKVIEFMLKVTQIDKLPPEFSLFFDSATESRIEISNDIHILSSDLNEYRRCVKIAKAADEQLELPESVKNTCEILDRPEVWNMVKKVADRLAKARVNEEVRLTHSELMEICNDTG